MESTLSLRPAQPDDIARLVALSSRQRAGYAEAQPLFWRVAGNADEKQAGFFGHLLTRDNVRVLLAEGGDELLGFLVAQVVAAPPVYDPGGDVLSIDDFAVTDEGAWTSVGRALLDAAQGWGRERGCVLGVVVCGHHDEAKRRMLEDAGFPTVSEWRVRALTDQPKEAQ